MRVRRGVLGAATIALAVAIGGQGSAPAQGLPSCPVEARQLKLTADDVGFKGQGFTVALERRGLEYSGRPVVANLVLNVGRGSSTVPLAIGEADESVEAVVTVPAGLDRFPLTAVWDQGLNTPSACHAEVSKGVWVVPPGASHGDPRRARFAGRYRVTYRPLNYKESRHKRRITWRVVPVCDYFACAGRLSSNAGISAGTVRLKANGTYRFRNHPRRAGANCVVEEVTTDRFTGQVLSRKRRTIRRAWVGSDRISLRVLKTDDAGRAVVLQGLHTATFAPTPNSEDAGCTHTYRYKDRVTLTLR